MPLNNALIFQVAKNVARWFGVSVLRTVTATVYNISFDMLAGSLLANTMNTKMEDICFRCLSIIDTWMFAQEMRYIRSNECIDKFWGAMHTVLS